MTGVWGVAGQERTAATGGRRHGHRPEVYVGAALIAVAFAALGTAAMVGDGTADRGEMVVVFALMLIPPLVGAVVALVFGRRLIKRMPPLAGADPATKRALRDGSTNDPRIDALARDEATRTLARGWVRWAAALPLLAHLAQVLLDDDLFLRAGNALGVVLWALVIVLRQRAHRLARRYLAT
ncbi:hypothetical protein [Micromonospora endolithica]|uniref:Uncharacterized protein n=1 Tax=Micromonospora endolithica TaxID=230091 RepID=A0A3A9ZMB7_9ACTN|nr:hypothetical protein [Micromonospora endolithica]RKN49423.1 hypothetical protein D7223_07990 [Micromonospora endolithica]TWJ23619.1 hypothetical protein JD76_03758 [Micromonospora endolithica]